MSNPLLQLVDALNLALDWTFEVKESPAPAQSEENLSNEGEPTE